MGNPVLRSNLPEDQAGCYCHLGLFYRQKTPVRILVHQSLLRARLYLISPTPRIFEVIILEKCGTGPELFNDIQRERMRSDIAMLRRLKKQDGMWFGTRRAPSRGIFQHPPQAASGIKRNSTEHKNPDSAQY